MKKQAFIAIAIFIAAILLTSIIIALKPDPVRVEEVKKNILVDVLEVQAKDLQLKVKAQGVVEPEKQTTLVAEVAGNIERISDKFLVGDLIKKGEFLLQISDDDYQIQIQRANASIISAQSALAQEQSLARVAQQEWEWRERKNLSPEAKEAALRRPQIRAAQANVQAARLEIKNAQKQISKTTIRAPYDGIVRSKQVEQGQFVSPGVPLGALFSIQNANIKLAVPQEKLKYLQIPSLNGYKVFPSVKISTEENSLAKTWNAKLIRSEGVVDPKTHFVNLIANIKDPYGASSLSSEPLRVGTFVFAEILGKTIHNVIELSNEYIQSGKYVWLVTSENKLEKREIEISYSEGDISYISAGLETGDKVCTTVLTGYLSGTEVKINTTESQISDAVILQDSSTVAQ